MLARPNTRPLGHGFGPVDTCVRYLDGCGQIPLGTSEPVRGGRHQLTSATGATGFRRSDLTSVWLRERACTSLYEHLPVPLLQLFTCHLFLLRSCKELLPRCPVHQPSDTNFLTKSIKTLVKQLLSCVLLRTALSFPSLRPFAVGSVTGSVAPRTAMRIERSSCRLTW